MAPPKPRKLTVPSTTRQTRSGSKPASSRPLARSAKPASRSRPQTRLRGGKKGGERVADIVPEAESPVVGASGRMEIDSADANVFESEDASRSQSAGHGVSDDRDHENSQGDADDVDGELLDQLPEENVVEIGPLAHQEAPNGENALNAPEAGQTFIPLAKPQTTDTGPTQTEVLPGRQEDSEDSEDYTTDSGGPSLGAFKRNMAKKQKSRTKGPNQVMLDSAGEETEHERDDEESAGATRRRVILPKDKAREADPEDGHGEDEEEDVQSAVPPSKRTGPDEDGLQSSGDEGPTRHGRVPDSIKKQARELFAQFLDDMAKLSQESGHARETLLLLSGASTKGHRAPQAWNAFTALYAVDNPRPKNVNRTEWLTTHVRPAYNALFAECDSTDEGQAKRREISQDLIQKKEVHDRALFKKYADNGRKYRVIQKVAAQLEQEARYAHNVCNVEVFGVVYEPTFGDINATAANTMFAGSKEVTAVLRDKRVAGKELIGEIQSLISVKLRQGQPENEVRVEPKNRDQWRQEVKRHFHALFFPEDEGGRKRVPWAKMPNWLYLQKKRLIRYPGKGPLPNHTFDLAKLASLQLQLLCKAQVGLEDWTEKEKTAADLGAVVIISSCGGRPLMRVQDVPQYKQALNKTTRGQHISLDLSSEVDQNQSSEEESSQESNKRPGKTSVGNKRKRDEAPERAGGNKRQRGGHKGRKGDSAAGGSSEASVSALAGGQAGALQIVDVELGGRTRKFVFMEDRMVPIEVNDDFV